jgi:hypothetical protein
VVRRRMTGRDQVERKRVIRTFDDGEDRLERNRNQGGRDRNSDVWHGVRSGQGAELFTIVVIGMLMGRSGTGAFFGSIRRMRFGFSVMVIDDFAVWTNLVGYGAQMYQSAHLPQADHADHQ